jgi:hypothetical protein
MSQLNSVWPGVLGDPPGVPGGDQAANNWWIDAFTDQMHHIAQQKASKLRNSVRGATCKANTYSFERLAPSTAVVKTTRHTTTPLLDLEHSRRRVIMTDLQWASLIDKEDERRMMVDPVSAYTTNAGMSMGRAWDDLIITAFGGDATDGSGTPVTFLGSQTIGDGTTPFDLDKFLSAKRIMDDNDVDMEGRYLAISPEEEQALLNLTEITSTDYNIKPTLVDGRVRRFLGCDIIVTTRLPINATVRDCYMWQKNAMGLAVNTDTTTSVDKRPDVSNALQVYCEFTANATRIDDLGVVKIENLVS